MNQPDLFADDLREADVRNSWRTPLDIWKPLDNVFHFVCDLASSDFNALCARHYTIDDDALAIDWPLDGWCWLNPPFALLPEFTAKLHEQAMRGARVVAIVPGDRHDKPWWHQHVLGVAAAIACPEGRVNYVAPPGVDESAVRFPSLVLIYDGKPSGVTMIQSLDALLSTREDGAA